MMKKIGLVSQKGGAGKTTLAVHLACLAAADGQKTVLIDCDPQRSVTKWYRKRQGADPIVVETASRDLRKVLNIAEEDGYDLAVVDTAPHANAETAEAVRNIDFAVVPCRPSSLDMEAIDITVELMRATHKPAAIVLNACDPMRGIAESSSTVEARAGLGTYGLPVAPTAIVDRKAMQYALIDGRAVTEFEPNGKAADELRKLWRWIEGQLETHVISSVGIGIR